MKRPREFVIAEFICREHGGVERLRFGVHRHPNMPASYARLEKFDERRGGREKKPRVVCGYDASHKTLFDALRPFIESIANGNGEIRYLLEKRI